MQYISIRPTTTLNIFLSVWLMVPFDISIPNCIIKTTIYHQISRWPSVILNGFWLSRSDTHRFGPGLLGMRKKSSSLEFTADVLLEKLFSQFSCWLIESVNDTAPYWHVGITWWFVERKNTNYWNNTEIIQK